MDVDTTTVEPELVAFVQKEAGWGPWIKVTVADTPEADAAAAEFFRRVCVYPRPDGEKYHVACIDEEASTPGVLGEALAEYFFPTCEHGMSAQLCYGPNHYPSAAEEMAMGW
jgi:hypothetical protein